MAQQKEQVQTKPIVFDGDPPKILIVSAPYYQEISQSLVTGAREACIKSQASFDIVEVAGALEIPPAIRIASQLTHYDGFVALGCVIRGETTHYETVCHDSSHGLMLLGLSGLCIGNGILTVENENQAVLRADPGGQNKGGGAAFAALQLVALSRKWGGEKRNVGFAANAWGLLDEGVDIGDQIQDEA